MSSIVIDASVAVKWFLPELHAKAACRLLSTKSNLLAPDLIWSEVGNTLWKKVQRRELTEEAARNIVREFQHFPLETPPSKRLLEPAWDIAERFRITVYDSLYIALAINRGCALVTADRTMYDAFTHGPLSSRLIWVEHLLRGAE